MSLESIPRTMKALRLVQYNQNYELQDDVPVPVPNSGEVLIRIAAASFCHTDYQVFQGDYKTQLPHIGSHEPTGTIVALGPGVLGGWKVGDRVGGYIFRKPCGRCSDCRWYAATHSGELHARYCVNKVMTGILHADGGFAQYMTSPEYALVKLPDNVPFEQAAPLMCAGATIWEALLAAELQKGDTVAIVGIGGLGILGIQFAKALGYRVIAVHHRDAASKMAVIPEGLKPDLIVNYTEAKAPQQIFDFTDRIGLDAAIVCTDNLSANDWILHRLHPKGTSVVLGLPMEGFHFDAFNLVFREIVLKGSLHSTVESMEKMLQVVSDHKIRSHINLMPLEEAQTLPERIHKHEFEGKAVVTMY